MSECLEVISKVVVDKGLTNIMSERLDAGVHVGDQFEKNKVAVRIGFDQHIVAVAASYYYEPQRKPRTPNDLTEHTFVNLRLPTPNVREGYTLRSSRGSPAS